MRSRLLLLLSAVASFGCVHFPDAGLVVGAGAIERIQGPVVCGPLGFRKVPLQSRWGEYVRVTVSAPSKLRGTVLVHALGEAQEPRTFETTGASTLIVDARFANEDPDVAFALDRERPIDLTITGLEALEGGTCEGAVFTVEHGALVPSIEERTWVAELERRGGPALIARREARARAEAQARAEAEAQARIAAEAQARADAQARAEAEAQARAEAEARAQAEAQARAQAEVQARAEAEARAQAEVQARAQADARASAALQSQANAAAQARAEADARTLAAVQSQASAGAQARADASAQVDVQVRADAQASATAQAEAQAQASAAVDADAWATIPVASSTVEQSSTSVSVSSEASVSTSGVASAGVNGAAGGAVVASNSDEWSQPFVGSAAAEAGWVQPYGARLEPMAVTTESRVAVGASTDFETVPAPPPSTVVVTAPAPQRTEVVVAPQPSVEVDAAAALWVPAMVNLVFSAAAALPPPPPAPRQVHAARPAR